ncbi:RimJ/RimL family protein N-acetyltransferase [Glaciihabitans tibetensis]|uniref:RimJ/RimL family protein N-acetyltransferase n=1 Tax=Glaciihabitans tibetensis TaxID=1266600 RepID=A0A2T0VF55_9MICO|nr:GNAT family N-acetyltransferase [Glaciihabitans tibetensis]PRY68829.1 RimJ/RimL family protein N-acetyltransferase [Glaciihabitans tibetensis]
MQPEIVLTQRLRLDSPVAADQERVFEYCQDPLFERYLTAPWPYTRAHARHFLERIVPSAWAADTEYTWAIRRRGASARDASEAVASEAVASPLIGVISFRRDHNSIGFWIGTPHRGLGYVPEAATAVAEWVFSLGVETIVWECVAGNLASASVARQLGFRFTGERDSTLPYRDGKLVPSWHAQLTPDNLRVAQQGWPAVTSAARRE